MASEWTQTEKQAAHIQFCLTHSFDEHGSICYTDAIELACQRNRALAALERIRFVCSDAGHAPCRCGGIDEEGNVCPNACNCDWPKEIIPIVHAAIAVCEKGGA
jgi:hypothetical protein